MKPADILASAAETFRERNQTYGENYRNIGPVLATMFPAGVTLKTAEDFQRFHYAVLLVVKLTRWASSGLTHIDSIHDAAVYAAMAQEATEDETNKRANLLRKEVVNAIQKNWEDKCSATS